MQLRINESYRDRDGNILIPRSHFTDEKGLKYAIFEHIRYTGGRTYFTIKHDTMSLRQIKAALDLSKNERVEII